MEPDSCRGLDHPKFKVNKRSMRDKLTLLITKHKAKIHQEETSPRSRRDNWQEKLADEKTLRGKEKRKGKKSSSRGPGGPQAKRYGTFRADPQSPQLVSYKTSDFNKVHHHIITVKRHFEHFVYSHQFPLFTWETCCPQQASAQLSNFPALNNVLDPVFLQCSSLSPS